MPRLTYFENRLGHKFFLEECLHIIHLCFFKKDVYLVSSWLKAIILRISFWKTKFIFRFLTYLFLNYFRHELLNLGARGIKIKLKGKISCAGNSRKKVILFRFGKTSHSEVSLKVIYKKDTIEHLLV